MHTREDAALVQMSLSGDQSAFGELIDRYKNVVYGLILNRIGDFDQAQDLAQEAFIETYVHLGTLRKPDKFPNWLYGITRNLCSKWQQRRRRELEVMGQMGSVEEETGDILMFDGVTEPRDPEEEYASRELKEAIWRTVSELPERSREAILLFYFNDISDTEIAKLLGVAPSTVRRHLQNGREKLKGKMMPFVEETIKEKALGRKFTEKVVAALPIIAFPAPVSRGPRLRLPSLRSALSLKGALVGIAGLALIGGMTAWVVSRDGSRLSSVEEWPMQGRISVRLISAGEKTHNRLQMDSLSGSVHTFETPSTGTQMPPQNTVSHIETEQLAGRSAQPISELPYRDWDAYVVPPRYVWHSGYAQGLDEKEGVVAYHHYANRRAVVTGRVTARADGRALSGVRIVDGYDRSRPNPEALTDSEGRYRLTRVQEVQTLIHALSEDFAPAMKTVTTWAGEETQVDFELVPGQNVTGRVTDPDGKPIAKAWVVTNPWNKARMFVRRPQTDEHGRFVLPHMPTTPVLVHLGTSDGRSLEKRDLIVVGGQDYRVMLKPVVSTQCVFALGTRTSLLGHSGDTEDTGCRELITPTGPWRRVHLTGLGRREPALGI